MFPESLLKYGPFVIRALTGGKPGQCMVGSLTGVVASKRVTEASKGTLRAIGNRLKECNGRRVLDWETNKSHR